MVIKYAFRHLKNNVIKNLIIGLAASAITTLLFVIRNQVWYYGVVGIVDTVFYGLRGFAYSFLILCAIQLLIYTIVFFKQRKLLAIYEEKGICGEYADEYKRVCLDNRANAYEHDKLYLASIYMELGRYDESYALYKSVNLKTLSPLGKCMYYNDIAYFSAKTGNIDEAFGILAANREYIEKNTEKNRIYFCGYLDTYAFVMTLRGEYGQALNALSRAYFKADDVSYMCILTRYVYVYAKMGDMRNAIIARTTAENYLAHFRKYPTKWYKEKRLAILEIAEMGKNY